MKIKKIIIITILLIICLYSNFIKATDLENWEEWTNEDYWEWHTRITDDDRAYNGNHIDIENDVINFYGYWKNSYKDFLYKDYHKQGKKIFKFIIDESECNYHTLDGAGFIFNANKKDDKLSGKIVLFKENDICIYKIENVDINEFENTANMTMDNYGELIITKPKPKTNIHNLVVEVTPTNIKISDNDNEIINQELKYEEHKGEGFGLISSYTQHACSILSKVKFKELKIKLEDYKVLILNTDMQDNPIGEGYFIVKDEDGNIIKEGKTDKNGEMIIDVIQGKEYTVQQKTAPTSYILNDNIYKFKVTENGKVIDVDTGDEIDVIIKNDKIKEEKEPEEEDEQKEVNETIENVVIEKEDKTIANKPIPNAGEKSLKIFLIITFISAISIILGIKIKKYKI